MTETSKISTRAIQSAAKGREADVLDALGIDWRTGRPHIACPYPDHDDGSPSWRFVQSKGRAFCTCIQGSHSVFDIAMKMRGSDFEDAKIFVCEALGRRELIKEHDPAERRFPATDPASLLNPAEDRRHDALVRAYIAFRLGLDAEAAPMPRTPFAGWAALPYFDPPASGRRNAKPAHVGDFPCAVFGTTSADGRRHAHRIYLAPEGAGKADLGPGPNGYARDPKKSAKVMEGDNTAGRSVLWGDPDRAVRIIVAEGIETAAAIAHVYAEAIEAGTVAVAAAISASGVEAFQPWTATKRITIAADRDEGAKADGKPGSRRGERAARRIGLRLHERMSIDIALPGAAGESIDFLDVLRRDGPEAVRSTIESGRAFAPTRGELEEMATSQGRAAELAEIAKVYPLPTLDTMELTYRHTESDRVKVHKVTWDRDPATGRREQMETPIATPFGVTARLRNADHADAYGLRIAVQDMNGRPRVVDTDRAQLARRGAPEVMTALYSAGLRTETDGEAIVLQALKAADPEREVVVLRRPGWQDLQGLPDPAFIGPAGTVMGAPEDIALELGAVARMAPDVASGGSFDGWRDATTAALRVEGCEHWTIGIVAAFAGPIVSLTGLDTCGVNLSGMSSGGKSTAQRLAASAWSTPDIRKPGLCQSARATDNAIEALAYRATGTVLSLDELAHVHGKEAGRMIYTIAGGVGKRRMNAEAAIRESYTWSTFAILSGECSLAEKVTRDGGEWSAGMAVRILDVDVTGINRTVAAATLERIDGIDRHFGHAGPAFVEAMIKAGIHRQPTALRERVLRAARQLAGDTADSATIRAATPLAIIYVAGELAKSFGIVPDWTHIGHAITWAWESFKRSADSIALSPDEQAIGNLREYAARRWGVTIKPLDIEGGVNNREAEGWYDEEAVYLPASTIHAATGHVLKERQVGILLEGRNMLARRDGDRYTVRWVPSIGMVRAYALKRSEFGRAGQQRQAFSWHDDLR